MTEQEQPVVDPDVETSAYAVRDNPHDDENDVPAALEQETDDGKGGAVVPAADFVSYSEADAETEETS